MQRQSKKIREIAKTVNFEQRYSVEEAVAILKKWPPAKFDESVEVSIKLGVDPRKAEQQVRGTVPLPNGTGKTLRILVFTKGEKVQEALDAGAVYAGHDELITKVAGGWTDFDAVISTPDMMRDVGKLGKILGPRGLMPTPKAGTVTPDITRAIQELMGGKIEYKVDKHGVINNAVGKISFAAEKIVENVNSLIDAIKRSKPSSAKGQFFRSFSLSTTMGPGIKIELSQVE